jgi:hypothetical protein
MGLRLLPHLLALVVAALGLSSAPRVAPPPVITRVLHTVGTPALGTGRFHVHVTRVSAQAVRVSMRLDARVHRATTLAVFASPCVGSPKGHGARFRCTFSLLDGKAIHVHAGHSPYGVTVMSQFYDAVSCVQIQAGDDEFYRAYNLLGPHRGHGIVLCPGP